MIYIAILDGENDVLLACQADAADMKIFAAILITLIGEVILESLPPETEECDHSQRKFPFYIYIYFFYSNVLRIQNNRNKCPIFIWK